VSGAAGSAAGAGAGWGGVARGRRRTEGPLRAPGSARAMGRSNSLPRVSRYALRRSFSSSSCSCSSSRESPNDRATSGPSRCQAKSASRCSARARRSWAAVRERRGGRVGGEGAAIEGGHPKEGTGEVKPVNPSGFLDAAPTSG